MIPSEIELHPDQPVPEPVQAQLYWRRTRRLTGWLLLVWLLVGFGLIFFARSLRFNFFGWPFGFWVAAQGALFVFCAIVAGYARAMRKLDQACRDQPRNA